MLHTNYNYYYNVNYSSVFILGDFLPALRTSFTYLYTGNE